MPNFKRQRTADSLREFLAAEVCRLGDPRLELVTITGVDMSPDLRNAWVYWSVLTLSNEQGEPIATSEKRLKEIHEVLDGASNLLKRRVAEVLKFRFTPALVFRHDHSLETSSRIEYLISKAGSQ